MMEELTNTTFAERVAATESGVCIFIKKLCPHCKNMLKVMEKFKAKQPEVALMTIDIEDYADIAEIQGAERAPTILVIKGGEVAAKKAGLMNPKEMLAFYQSV